MTTHAETVPLREAGRLRSMVDLYLTTMRLAVQQQFQYRTANYFWMLGMVAEPVIYLVVWTTIADQQGGSVQGLTAGYFAAYYIVWTLVRNMNIVFGAPFWEERIREGELNKDLLRPVLPLHYDIAFFAGWKVVVIVLWIPLAIGLSLVFDPVLDPRLLEIAVFAVAIWGAYLLRTMFQEALGMLCFWTTRGAAIFDLWMMTELLLSVAAAYPGQPLMVTENGAAFEDEVTVAPDGTPRVHDERRVAYLHDHVDAVGAAIDAGADVRGYHAWTLMDNFEWSEGYAQRFGLAWVDFEDPQRRRVLKESGRWFGRVAAENGFDT